MSRLRLAAGLLACLTLLVAGLFSLNADVSATVIGGTALAALALAATVPFSADHPRGRKRILLASLAAVALLATALLAALRGSAGGAAVLLLAGLAFAGSLLALWAFLTRNRRRRPAWSNYYDM